MTTECVSLPPSPTPPTPTPRTGLTLIVSILKGDVIERRDDVATVMQALQALITQHRIKGLAQVLVSGSIDEGMINM